MDIKQLQQNLTEIEKQIIENQEILNNETDPELIKLVEEEINELQKRKQTIEEQIKNLSMSSAEKTKSVIVEIRAGTGGEEAALFAASLFRMYARFAEKQGWKFSILDSNRTSLKGYKEVIFELIGSNLYSKMRQESGVHRVQRIPETEKGGRIHTSTATVAVLPRVEKEEIKIEPKDLRIDVFRSSGPGGQYVNKRESAVRVTHLPTGIVAASQQERTQQSNKEIALKILRSKLYAIKLEEELKKEGAARREQIGTGERSEKIRTYNFPQDRITDHRIGKSWHNIENVLNGNLESIIKAFEKK